VKTGVLTAIECWTCSNHWIFRGLSLKNLWWRNLYSHFGIEFYIKFWNDDFEVKTRISCLYKIRINGFTVHCRSIDQWMLIYFISELISRTHCIYSSWLCPTLYTASGKFGVFTLTSKRFNCPRILRFVRQLLEFRRKLSFWKVFKC
jgi:hypothetical protein